MFRFYNTAHLRTGFTLIEMMTVIVIIVTLIAISAFGLTGGFEAGRDTRRRSDLRQLQLAVEKSSNDNSGLYPSRTSSSVAKTTTCQTDLGYTASECPDDPKYESGDTSWPRYRYRSNGTGSGNDNATQFILWARLEDVSTTTWLVVCSNGVTGVTTTAPTGASGACPL